MLANKLLPAIVVAAPVLWLSYILSQSPLQFSIVIPNGVNVRVDNPQAFQSQQQVASPRLVDQRVPVKKPKQQLPEPDSSILDAITAFQSYHHTTKTVLKKKRERFERLPAAHRPLAKAIGYEAHFGEASKGAATNAKLLEDIAEYARDLYGFNHGEEAEDNRYEVADDFVGHVVRDWTVVGQPERDQVYPPIKAALKTGLAGVTGKKRILVPGFGMGRLAHELADNDDYSVDACELDYGSIIAYRYLLNQTTSLNQFELHPWVKDWTHRSSTNRRFRSVQIPDMLPTSPVHLIEGDFLEALPQDEQYDAIVTLFFIDVSQNIVDFLNNIHRLLKPGGVWINLGPFKWGKWSQMQIGAEEAMKLAELIGFDVDHNSHKSIDTVYAHQPESLLKFTYVTQFWTATKRL